jgi:ABC-2 type transport system ATP-binding protein
VDVVIERATFRYRSRDAPVFEGLDLVFSPGRTILLGPNGAGKSTLLAAAASAVPVNSGSISVGGVSADSRRDRSRYRGRIGWMPQAVRAAGGLKVREHVALHGWLAGLSRAAAWERSRDALVRVGLDDLENRKATSLSGGQAARMGLAQALVHGADVLLLDEPTAALDPDQKESFGTLVAELADGRTIVVSTHDVSDLATTYDHVVVLDHGRVRFTGTTDQFVATDAGALTAVDAYRRAIGQG